MIHRKLQTTDQQTDQATDQPTEQQTKQPKKRGRPAKTKVEHQPEKKPRGRRPGTRLVSEYARDKRYKYKKIERNEYLRLKQIETEYNKLTNQ